MITQSVTDGAASVSKIANFCKNVPMLYNTAKWVGIFALIIIAIVLFFKFRKKSNSTKDEEKTVEPLIEKFDKEIDSLVEEINR
jgi:uncharacterized membrane protein YvbJ